MEHLECIEIVWSLNDAYYETHGGQECPPWEYRTDATCSAIMFHERCLWNDQNDPREWPDDDSEQEPLKEWLLKEVQKLATDILAVHPLKTDAAQPESR